MDNGTAEAGSRNYKSTVPTAQKRFSTNHFPRGTNCSEDSMSIGRNPNIPSSPSSGQLSENTTVPAAEPQSADCPICLNEYANWNVLQCSHQLCSVCYQKIEKTRTTMGGVTHTFVKCPFCLGVSGVEIGTTPDGTMTTNIIPTPCEGYEGYKTICIDYKVMNPEYPLRRIAYLPDNKEGKEVLKLLKIAWDRRLCFAIGTSATTGQENVLVWNIHHKTAPNGGIYSYGFPDDTYLKRVKTELKAFGIE